MFSGISDIINYEPVEVFDFKTPTMDFKNQEEGEAILVPVNEVSNIKKEVTNDNLKKIEKRISKRTKKLTFTNCIHECKIIINKKCREKVERKCPGNNETGCNGLLDFACFIANHRCKACNCKCSNCII